MRRHSDVDSHLAGAAIRILRQYGLLGFLVRRHESGSLLVNKAIVVCGATGSWTRSQERVVYTAGANLRRWRDGFLARRVCQVQVLTAH